MPKNQRIVWIVIVGAVMAGLVVWFLIDKKMGAMVFAIAAYLVYRSQKKQMQSLNFRGFLGSLR